MIGDDAYFLQVMSIRETSLRGTTTWRSLRQDRSSMKTAAAVAVLAHTTGTGSHPYKPLLPSLSSTPSPKSCWKAVKSNAIGTNHNCRAEKTYSLSYKQPWSNCGQQAVHELVKEAEGITAKFSFQILFPNLFRVVITRIPAGKSSSSIAGSWEWLGVTYFLPLLYKWRRGAFLIFYRRLEAAEKPRHFSKGVMAVILCSWGVNKIVGSWNSNVCRKRGNNATIITVYHDA